MQQAAAVVEPAGVGARDPVVHAAEVAPRTTVRSVFEDHFDYVWRSLRRLGVPEADVDDAVQEVFVVVHRKLPEFEARSKLTTWLFGICYRVASDWQRRAHVRREQPTEELPEQVDQEASPEEGYQGREARAKLDGRQHRDREPRGQRGGRGHRSRRAEAPTRNDVLNAMRSVAGAVNACGRGQTGTATVSITFASSGRVTTASVAPPFAGTPAGACIARAVRHATVPPFTRPTFQVNYPFVIR